MVEEGYDGENSAHSDGDSSAHSDEIHRHGRRDWKIVYHLLEGTFT